MKNKIVEIKDNLKITVDEKDYELLKLFNWKFYKGSVRATINLSRLLMKNRDDEIVDHKNGNNLDYRRINLRVCTQQQNSWNRKKPKTNSHLYKGTLWSKKWKRWLANLKKDGKRYYGKCRKTEKEAAIDYDILATKYFGEYARLNFPL